MREAIKSNSAQVLPLLAQMAEDRLLLEGMKVLYKSPQPSQKMGHMLMDALPPYTELAPPQRGQLRYMLSVMADAHHGELIERILQNVNPLDLFEQASAGFESPQSLLYGMGEDKIAGFDYLLSFAKPSDGEQLYTRLVALFEHPRIVIHAPHTQARLAQKSRDDLAQHMPKRASATRPLKL